MVNLAILVHSSLENDFSLSTFGAVTTAKCCPTYGLGEVTSTAKVLLTFATICVDGSRRTSSRRRKPRLKPSLEL